MYCACVCVCVCVLVCVCVTVCFTCTHTSPLCTGSDSIQSVLVSYTRVTGTQKLIWPRWWKYLSRGVRWFSDLIYALRLQNLHGKLTARTHTVHGVCVRIADAIDARWLDAQRWTALKVERGTASVLLHVGGDALENEFLILLPQRGAVRRLVQRAVHLPPMRLEAFASLPRGVER